MPTASCALAMAPQNIYFGLHFLATRHLCSFSLPYSHDNTIKLSAPDNLLREAWPKSIFRTISAVAIT